MLITPRLTSKPAPYILYPLIFILSLFLSLSWVSAKEQPKPNPQAWQINGIVAALGDGYDQVKGYAFDAFVRSLKAKPSENGTFATTKLWTSF